MRSSSSSPAVPADRCCGVISVNIHELVIFNVFVWLRLYWLRLRRRKPLTNLVGKTCPGPKGVTGFCHDLILTLGQMELVFCCCCCCYVTELDVTMISLGNSSPNSFWNQTGKHTSDVTKTIAGRKSRKNQHICNYSLIPPLCDTFNFIQCVKYLIVKRTFYKLGKLT